MSGMPCPQALAQRCTGFTGADLAALCREAKYQALEESLDMDTLQLRHFEAALQLVMPSLVGDWEAEFRQFGITTAGCGPWEAGGASAAEE